MMGVFVIEIYIFAQSMLLIQFFILCGTAAKQTLICPNILNDFHPALDNIGVCSYI